MTLRAYRLMNLGIGTANEGHYGRLGSVFYVCDDCLPKYDPAVTKNIDVRLVEDLQVSVPTDAKCAHHSHAASDGKDGHDDRK